VGLRHLFTSKFLPIVGELCTEELDIAFIHASAYQIDPAKKIALTISVRHGDAGDAVASTTLKNCPLFGKKF